MTGQAVRPSVELFRWRPSTGDNFGDQLAEVVVAKMLALRGLSLASPARRPARLLAIGSILHFAQDGDVIWGTGRNGKAKWRRHRFRTLDVRAVRGPLTRRVLRSKGVDCPAVYGDPAMLLPHLCPDLHVQPERDVIVVPNLNDNLAVPVGVEVLDPRQDWQTCVRAILGAQLVVASSLHGVVVADAFGIPARLVRSTHEPRFKYRDHYLGTGRQRTYACPSVAAAIDAGGAPPPAFDPAELMSAFPWDLWEAQA